MRMLALLVAVAFAVTPADAALAKADYAQGLAIGAEYRYLDPSTVPAELQEDLLTATRFWLPHLSPATSIDSQRPIKLDGTNLYRIDLNALHWSVESWCRVFGGVLCPHNNPLVARMDVLLYYTSDTSRNDGYYQLLYQGKPPANEAEFFAFWRIDTKQATGRERAHIIPEGESGVAHGTRLVEWRQGPAAYGWATRDSRNPVGKQDPIENLLLGKLTYDAGEFIVGIHKFDPASGLTGTAQAYLLSNGQGVRVEEADAQVVSSSEPNPVIRNPGSCVLCHGQGINPLGKHELRELLASGAVLYDRDGEEIERLHLSALSVEVERNQQDFAAFVQMACGCEPAVAVNAYRRILYWYEQPVTLEQAAVETGATAEELTNAIAYYSTLHAGLKQPGRLSGLASGVAVSRDTWDQATYHEAIAALAAWRAKK